MDPPAELVAAPQWVARDANKEPISPRVEEGKAEKPLRKGKSNDPETWGTYDEACVFRERWGLAGIGFVLGSGYAGVDLDKCRDPETGQIEAWAWQIVCELDSYTEVSPSGTGLHIIACGSLPPDGRRCGRIEMYDQGQYFTVTGQHLAGTPATVEERTSELAALHARIFPPAPPRVPRRTEATEDDAGLIERMLSNPTTGPDVAALWRGDLSGVDGDDSRADWRLCRSLAYWTGGDPERMDRLFRQSGLYRDKWDRPEGTYGTYGRRTISKVLGNA